jgi:hypothetical protein
MTVGLSSSPTCEIVSTKRFRIASSRFITSGARLCRAYWPSQSSTFYDMLRSSNFPPDGKSEFVMRVVASHGGLTGDKTA